MLMGKALRLLASARSLVGLVRGETPRSTFGSGQANRMLVAARRVSNSFSFLVNLICLLGLSIR
jgi:hypothetical protein